MATASDGNGGPKTKVEYDRWDQVKNIVVILTTVGLAMGALLFIFQTKADAIAEHAAIEKEAALQKQAAGFAAGANKDTQKMFFVVWKNQTKLMAKRGLKEEIAPLPAGIDFDDLDLLEPE